MAFAGLESTLVGARRGAMLALAKQGRRGSCSRPGC